MIKKSKSNQLVIAKHQAYDTTGLDTIFMYSKVYKDDNGFLARIGDPTFNLREARKNIIGLLEHNNHNKLRSLYGKHIIETMDVRRIECYKNGYFIQILDYPYWEAYDNWIQTLSTDNN